MLVFDLTRCVFTVKVALVLPACTVTLDGTVATDVLLLDSPTVTPPEGAAPVSVTVPVERLPPLTLVGFSVSDESVTVSAGQTSASFTVRTQRVSSNTNVVISATYAGTTKNTTLTVTSGRNH